MKSDDGITFTDVEVGDISSTILTGNTDKNTAVTHVFSSTFCSRVIRLYPLTWKNNINMRWEAYYL